MYPKFEGIFSTSNADEQEMIEKDERFGPYLTHEIFLYQSIAEAETEAVVQAEPEIIPEKKETVTNSNQMTFVQAKQHLIEKGVSPDELKNFLQVKSQAAKIGIEIVK